MKSVLVIGGPTSSGKTALSIKLAKKLDAEIISLDAVQIYDGLIVGSGAASKEEQDGIPHHLIGIYSPNEPIDVAKVREISNSKIKEIEAKGKKVIICAGSTMYLSILIHGIADIPSSSKELREKYKELNSEALWNELHALDPVAANSLSKSDRQRIERALEVKIITGESIKTLQKEHRFPEPLRSFHLVSLWWNRQDLYQKIESRCKQMIANGLIEETRTLIERYGADAPALRSIGYKEFVKYINGEFSKPEAEEKMIQATKNYAKRQMTFWKNEPSKRGWHVSPNIIDSDAVILGDEVPIKRGPKPKGVIAWNWSFNRLCEGYETLAPDKGVSLWNLSAVSLL